MKSFLSKSRNPVLRVEWVAKIRTKRNKVYRNLEAQIGCCSVLREEEVTCGSLIGGGITRYWAQCRLCISSYTIKCKIQNTKYKKSKGSLDMGLVLFIKYKMQSEHSILATYKIYCKIHRDHSMVNC